MLALQGFGGVLAVAQHHLVERRRWLRRDEFLQLLSLAQVLPGPNIINLALMLGDRWFGWRGAVAAVAGLMAAPLAIALALATLYAEHAHRPAVAGALRGMGIAAAGLIAAMALKLLPALARHPLGRGGAAGVAVLAFGAVALARWPLVLVLPVLGGGAVGLTAWALRRQDRREADADPRRPGS